MKTKFTKMDAVLIIYFILAITIVNACATGKKSVVVTKQDKCPVWVSK